MFAASNPRSFSRRASAAALLSFAAIVATAPVRAQDGAADKPKAPSAPHQSLEPIAADGFAKFMELMKQFAQDQIAKLPSADKSPRENAFGKLAAIQLAGARILRRSGACGRGRPGALLSRAGPQ